MKKILIGLICLPMMAMAQVQKGVVRTTGNAKQLYGSIRWPGTNILGFALMEVRDTIRENVEY